MLSGTGICSLLGVGESTELRMCGGGVLQRGNISMLTSQLLLLRKTVSEDVALSEIDS
jgi:hypothetical protein